MDSQVNMSVVNDVDFLEFRFGGTIRQTCLFTRKFRRFFEPLSPHVFATSSPKRKSVNEEALKLTVFKFRFYSTVFGPPFIKWAQVFRS